HTRSKRDWSSDVCSSDLTPPAPAAPLDQLRALLVSGVKAGKAGDKGDALFKNLDAAEQALAKGDKRRAAEQLRELVQRLLQGARSEERRVGKEGRGRGGA